MGSRTFESGRTIAARLAHGGDLLRALTQLAREHDVKVAHLSAIGALSSARVAFYDQAKKEYCEIAFDEPVEIAGCSGTITRRDGATAVHAHLALTRADGSAVGGHLIAGCTIFACEAVLTELLGEILEREHDHTTGLPLWRGL
jgi:predicted DNA-binding protein with PD1-like motif